MLTDLDKLQGAWDVLTLEIDGRDVPAASFPGSQIIVSKDRFTSAAMGASYAGTFELGGAKTIKTIDMSFSAGPPAGTRQLGIYKLNGDSWTICLAMRGTTRPSRFATRPDSGIALQTFTRAAKAGGGRVFRPGISTELPPSSAPPTPLEGEWAMVEGVFNGAAMDKSAVVWARRLTHGDVTKVVAGTHTMLEARFTIDEKASPRSIDYDNLSGSNKGKKQAGIWEIAGDTLRVCMSAPGKPRPKDFASTKGDGRSFTTWRRNA
jgi:uncharacterized protein (TIGR03067 family)